MKLEYGDIVLTSFIPEGYVLPKPAIVDEDLGEEVKVEILLKGNWIPYTIPKNKITERITFDNREVVILGSNQ